MSDSPDDYDYEAHQEREDRWIARLALYSFRAAARALAAMTAGERDEAIRRIRRGIELGEGGRDDD